MTRAAALLDAVGRSLIERSRAAGSPAACRGGRAASPRATRAGSDSAAASMRLGARAVLRRERDADGHVGTQRQVGGLQRVVERVHQAGGRGASTAPPSTRPWAITTNSPASPRSSRCHAGRRGAQAALHFGERRRRPAAGRSSRAGTARVPRTPPGGCARTASSRARQATASRRVVGSDGACRPAAGAVHAPRSAPGGERRRTARGRGRQEDGSTWCPRCMARRIAMTAL